MRGDTQPLRPLRIAMAYLSGGGLSGGAATTLRAQIPLLQSHPMVDELRVYLPQASSDLDVGIESIHTWPAKDRWQRFRTLRNDIQKWQPDVVFVPTAVWFNADDIPVVTMVRNMESARMPFGNNPLLGGIKNILRRWLAKHSCRRANRIIAVSQFVKDFLTESWCVPAEKVGVVCHGVAEAIPPAQSLCPTAMNDQPAAAKKFWFTAGSIIPYRRLEDAIIALAKRPADEFLCIAGKNVYSDAYQQAMQKLAAGCGVADRVIWLGHCNRAEMAWCFQQCIGFVMTSRVEACPNVVLETLSQGCAAISNSNPPMSEFFHEAALYYTTGNADELAAQMAKLANDAVLRQTLRQTARQRAKQFTWACNVERTIAELQAAVNL